MSRRAANELIVILWRDIPAQVTARAGEQRSQVILPMRFQKAIDRAAMVAGLTTAQDYVAEWRRVTQPLDGPADEVAARTAAQLELDYPNERLHVLIDHGGWNPADAQGAPT